MQTLVLGLPSFLVLQVQAVTLARIRTFTLLCSGSKEPLGIEMRWITAFLSREIMLRPLCRTHYVAIVFLRPFCRDYFMAGPLYCGRYYVATCGG